MTASKGPVLSPSLLVNEALISVSQDWAKIRGENHVYPDNLKLEWTISLLRNITSCLFLRK